MRKELKRKLFHLLTLGYLALFWALGGPGGDNAVVLWILGMWIAVEGIIEAVRLRMPRFNAWLIFWTGGIHREEEVQHVSGIFWTTVGAWLTIFFFGAETECVTAALLYLSLGDAAAALAGLQFGKTKWGQSPRAKSVEGSLACFATCLISGFAAGLRGSAPWIGAATATAFEFIPLPFNDNIWMPLGAALALWLVS